MQIAAGRQSLGIAHRVTSSSGWNVPASQRCQSVVDFVRSSVERIPQALEIGRHGLERRMLLSPGQGDADDAARPASRDRSAASRRRLRFATVRGQEFAPQHGGDHRSQFFRTARPAMHVKACRDAVGIEQVDVLG